MSERVLVVPTEVFQAIGVFQGFCDRVDEYLPHLLDARQQAYLPRTAAESDPKYKQLIPYVVLRCQGKLFHYQRAGGSEQRLHARRSIGIGGHINAEDGSYEAGLRREVEEEVNLPPGWQARCIGLLNDDRTPVGQVHLGIVHVVDLDGETVTSREAQLTSGGFALPSDLLALREEFETWSQLLLDGPFLKAARGRASP